MGVQGLWDLVSPAGQRVNLSALENKIIAVDASIWMYHFLKAMRDEHGNMVKGAHLLGFFRRICKLLYLKIKPVFVFDGPPPRLKLNTLALRAQHRDTEERNRRKAVEKLLRNQLKMHVLEAQAESAQESAAASGSAALPGNPGFAADAGTEVDELGGADAAAEEAGDGAESDKSAGSHVEEVPDTEVPVGGRRWQRRQWRRRQGGVVPQAFQGFMAKRRGVSEVALPELPDEPLRDILQVPDRRRGRTSRMSEPDEWKGYVVPGGGIVTIPLDGPVALEDFQVLSPKTKYTLLQRAQEAWYGESRLKAAEAKDDMGAFVNVQLETFLRHIRTNKEIEKVKREMAEESRPGNKGVAEGDVYTPPSWLQPASDTAPAGRGSSDKATGDDAPRAGTDRLSAVIDEMGDPSAAAESSDAPASRRPRRKGRGRGFRQLNGAEVVARLQPVEHLNTALRDCLGEAEDKNIAIESVREHVPGPIEKSMVQQVTNSVEDLFGSDFFQDSGAGSEDEDVQVGNAAILTPPRTPPTIRSQPAIARKEALARSEGAAASEASSLDDLFDSGSHHDDEDVRMGSEREDEQISSLTTFGPRRALPTGNSALLTPTRTCPRLRAQLSDGAKKAGEKSEAGRLAPIASTAVDDLFGSDFFCSDEDDHELSRGAALEVDTPSADEAAFVFASSPLKQYPIGSVSSASVSSQHDALEIDSCSQKDVSRAASCSPHRDTAVSRVSLWTPQISAPNNCSASSEVSGMEPQLHAGGDGGIKVDSANTAVDEFSHSSADDGSGSANPENKSFSDIGKKNDISNDVRAASVEDRLHTMEDQPLERLAASQESKVECNYSCKPSKLAEQVEDNSNCTACLDSPGSESQQAESQQEAEPQLQEAGSHTSCSQTPHRDRSRSREATRKGSNTFASERAMPGPTPQALDRRKRQGGVGEPKADSWCTVHFQYSWRCREDGLDCAAAAGTRDSAQAASVQQRSSGGRARASDAARGKDHGDVAGLADEDLEDLELQRLQAELEDERQELRGEMHRAKRNLETVTPEMQADVERLLEAFGIPFVHSPAEAEAQCVFLAEADLVDAVATDDSDALVFGAREIYRRLFSEDHMVECYTATRVEAKLGLLRNDLIALAMLLGCDYTLGVHGVGMVNGLEIVRSFAPKHRGFEQADAQAERAAWMEQLGSLQSWAQNVADWGQDSAGVDASDPECIADFKVAHRNFRTQWSFPTPFPHLEVFKAFSDPVVDRSLERPVWGSVDEGKVVSMLVSATGLAQDKVRERLDPALQRYKDTLRQPRITEYMVPTGVGDVAVVRSSRMRNALRGLRGETSPERCDPDPGPSGDPEAKRTAKRRKTPAKSSWSLRPNEGGPILLDVDL